MFSIDWMHSCAQVVLSVSVKRAHLNSTRFSSFSPGSPLAICMPFDVCQIDALKHSHFHLSIFQHNSFKRYNEKIKINMKILRNHRHLSNTFCPMFWIKFRISIKSLINMNWIKFHISPFRTQIECAHTDSSSDDDASIPEERIATPDREYNYPRDHLLNSREKMKLPSSRDHSGRHASNISERRPQNLPPPVSNSESIDCDLVF